MENMENNQEKKDEQFEYTYTAPTAAERREAEEIRKRYQEMTVNEDRITRLRKLDEKAKTPPMVWAISLGVFGTLIFGGGFTIILEEMLASPYHLILGSAICVVGMLPIGLAYPVYKYVLQKCKAKYGEEILRLSEEILNEKEKENKE